MKSIAYLFAFLLLTSCDQSPAEQKPSTEASAAKTDSAVNRPELPGHRNATDKHAFIAQELRQEGIIATITTLNDAITADFNGDGKLDKAIFKKMGETSGILITHGGTNDEVSIGFGEPFALLLRSGRIGE